MIDNPHIGMACWAYDRSHRVRLVVVARKSVFYGVWRCSCLNGDGITEAWFGVAEMFHTEREALRAAAYEALAIDPGQ